MRLPLSTLMTSLLAASVLLSGCQKQQDPEPTLHEKIENDQAVPMSAEPADTNLSAAEVEQVTVAQVETSTTQLSYVCTPELNLDINYNDGDNEVTVNTPQGSVILEQNGDGAYEAATALDGTVGLTQWRVATSERDSGVLRVSAGTDEAVTAYECQAAE